MKYSPTQKCVIEYCIQVGSPGFGSTPRGNFSCTDTTSPLVYLMTNSLSFRSHAAPGEVHGSVHFVVLVHGARPRARVERSDSAFHSQFPGIRDLGRMVCCARQLSQFLELLAQGHRAYLRHDVPRVG